MATPNVAVIGGGWAGMACAVRLQQAGARVTVYEAARTLGGRARRVEVDGVTLDNGQHILLGAYHRCLALLREVGIGDDALLRLPLALELPGRFRFVTPAWPAPWHIVAGALTAQGLGLRDKLALLRWMVSIRLNDYQVPAGRTVRQWTASLPAAVRHWLIDPLCIAALNTPTDEADAAVFATVLRDSLGGSREWSDLLVPRVDLSALFPDAAMDFLKRHGSQVHIGRTVHRLEPWSDAPQWRVDTDAQRFYAIVIATAAPQAARLLRQLNVNELRPVVDALDALQYQPITTVYLRPRVPLTLPRPMLALDEQPVLSEFGQYIFDRGQCGGPEGWLAVVISASRAAQALSHEQLIAACAAQINSQLGITIDVADAQVISEKRATFHCAPGIVRPTAELPIAGLYLAGDYTAGPYPATLEQAVRSGERAAALAIAGAQ